MFKSIDTVEFIATKTISVKLYVTRSIVIAIPLSTGVAGSLTLSKRVK